MVGFQASLAELARAKGEAVRREAAERGGAGGDR
jgi:hypothetical protein